jgi:peroxiredoxin
MILPDSSSEPTATLRSKIDVWAQKHATEYPREVLELFAKKTEDLLKSGIVSNSAQVGSVVSDFALPANDGMTVRLSEKVREGPVILSFYRGTWCHFCTVEFHALLETIPQFRSRGASVLAISPQVRETFDVPAHSHGLVNLSDRSNRVARNFGLVYPLGDDIRRIYEGFGIRLDILNEDDRYEVPIPATYIIDGKMTIRYAFASVELTERAEPTALLAEVEAVMK